MDIAMQKAVDDFVLNRINYHGNREPDRVQAAFDEWDAAVVELKTKLPEDAIGALIDCANAFCTVQGETADAYYRAGFADAVEFIFGWRDCD